MAVLQRSAAGRVVRHDRRAGRADAIETLLDAARWAPTAGNRHLRRFVATDDPAMLRVLRAVSPGMLQRPTAAITICTDRALATRYGLPPDAPGLSVDVGTTMATLLPAAHAIGVGAGPVTSSTGDGPPPARTVSRLAGGGELPGLTARAAPAPAGSEVRVQRAGGTSTTAVLESLVSRS